MVNHEKLINITNTIKKEENNQVIMTNEKLINIINNSKNEEENILVTKIKNKLIILIQYTRKKTLQK